METQDTSKQLQFVEKLSEKFQHSYVWLMTAGKLSLRLEKQLIERQDAQNMLKECIHECKNCSNRFDELLKTDVQALQEFVQSCEPPVEPEPEPEPDPEPNPEPVPPPNE